MIGSLLVNIIIALGRRKTLLISQGVALTGALMFQVPNFWVLLIGKIIYGIGTGMAMTGVALYFSETIPASRTGRYGFAINLGIVVGVTIALSLGFFKPSADAPLETQQQALIIFNCLPVALACVVILLWTCAFREEPINFCLKQESAYDEHL